MGFWKQILGENVKALKLLTDIDRSDNNKICNQEHSIVKGQKLTNIDFN